MLMMRRTKCDQTIWILTNGARVGHCVCQVVRGLGFQAQPGVRVWHNLSMILVRFDTLTWDLNRWLRTFYWLFLFTAWEKQTWHATTTMIQCEEREKKRKDAHKVNDYFISFQWRKLIEDSRAIEHLKFFFFLILKSPVSFANRVFSFSFSFNLRFETNKGNDKYKDEKSTRANGNPNSHCLWCFNVEIAGVAIWSAFKMISLNFIGKRQFKATRAWTTPFTARETSSQWFAHKFEIRHAYIWIIIIIVWYRELLIIMCA